MTVKRFLALLTLQILWLTTPAWAGNFVFRHLDMSDGLSHYSVMALYQDERGRIWMGTRNGISVYDGGAISVHKHSRFDSTSIHNSYIHDITGNQNGILYILTNRGVSSYDVNKETFSTIYEGEISDIAFVANTLYATLGHKVLRYDTKENKFLPFYELPDNNLHISCMYMDGSNLMMGTENNGLFAFHLKEKSLNNILTEGRICDIFKDTKGRYWIGTWEHGLYIINGQTIENHRSQKNDESSLCADFVRRFCEDKQGGVWVGTFQGLNKYVEETGTFERFQPNDKTQLTNSSIWSLMCDAQGTIWAGTYFGGINYFNASQTVCQHYIVDKDTNGSLVVGTMTEDNEHFLWICTEGNGLCRLNPQTGVAKWYKHREGASNSISHNNLKSIYFDKEKNVLWIGTHLGGLNKFDLKTERFTHYTCGTSSKSNIVCDIVPYKDELLLATHDGVYSFNPQDETRTAMFKNAATGDIIEIALDLQMDTHGVLWIAGTDKGVYSYDFKSGKLQSHEYKKNDTASISSNGVNYLYEDSDSRLWLCMAESGIDLYNEETDTFENFDEEHNGLLSNCVYGAYGINTNKLLFITDNGFAYFDYTTKQFRNFKANISLPLTGINQKSIYFASNGRIYIGGVDGLISFYPEELEQMTSTYQIFPSKLFINDKEIKVGDETDILKETLPNTQKITLNYDQNMFSIAFSVTNYIPLMHEDLVYKLENFSNTWNTMRNGQMITYTNLSPGTYTLIVKNPGFMEHSCRLEIEILPPWYHTPMAYLCYLFILCLFLYAILHFYKNRVKLQAELEYERKHIKDIESLNQYKLRFFTNISHEFRTPLTIIIGQMELLLQIKSFTPAVYNRILNVYKSSMQLQSLITELLDFRKQEQGHMKIKASQHNMVAFLQENYLLFKEYAQIKGVEFCFIAPEEPIEVWYDSKQMQKVINNLLSNAFQYTPKGGTITLQLAQEANKVNISVSDTGKGIKSSELMYIFDRFYQTDATILTSTKGSGIGLALTKGIIELHHGNITVESEEGKGSIFTFSLLLGNTHFSPEEIVNEGSSHLVTETDEERRKDVNMMEEEELNLTEHQTDAHSSRILIVEDDEGLRNMLVEIFQPYYRVEQASNGQEGLDKVKELLPDIVLSDVLMPSMSGIELCKQIKNDVETSHIPVVLLTARTAIEHKLEGLQYGADDYIVKPFDVNILLARCKNLVNTRIALQEKFSKQPQVTPQVFATNPLDKEFMDRVMAIIEDNLDNAEFKVNEFAELMAIARTNLFVKLKAITGQTPNEFILTVRMKKAAYLLKNHPELNISEISDRTGFSSPRYFSRVFKERYNLTPQAYRKANGLTTDEETNDIEAE